MTDLLFLALSKVACLHPLSWLPRRKPKPIPTYSILEESDHDTVLIEADHPGCGPHLYWVPKGDLPLRGMREVEKADG